MRRFFLVSVLIGALLLCACGSAALAPHPTETNGVPDGRDTDAAPVSAEESTVDFTAKVVRTNWSEAPQIKDKCLNSYAGDSAPADWLPVYKLDSLAQLDAFKADFSPLLALELGHGNAEPPSFAQATAPYDEAFFENNSLLVTYVTANSGSMRFGIQDVVIDRSTMCLQAAQVNDVTVGTCDMAGWLLWAEVPKAQIAACNSFTARLADCRTAESSSEPTSTIEPLPADVSMVSTVAHIVYGEFSYDEYKRSLDLQAAGVQTEGFVNTQPAPAFEPVERAKAEVTADYNAVETRFDSEQGVWMVHFFNTNWAGGDVTVCMDEYGVTLLVCGGE